MEKVYIVYYSNYEDVVRDGADATEIIGVYKNKDEAIKVAKERIKKTLEDHERMLDIERDDIDRDNYVRFFWGWQENWSCYFELCVDEKEVK